MNDSQTPDFKVSQEIKPICERVRFNLLYLTSFSIELESWDVKYIEAICQWTFIEIVILLGKITLLMTLVQENTAHNVTLKPNFYRNLEKIQQDTFGLRREIVTLKKNLEKKAEIHYRDLSMLNESVKRLDTTLQLINHIIKRQKGG